MTAKKVTYLGLMAMAACFAAAYGLAVYAVRGKWGAWHG